MTQAAHEGRPIAQRIPAGATEPPIVAYRIPEQKGRGWSVGQRIGAGAAAFSLLGGAVFLGSRIGGGENNPTPPAAVETDQAPDTEAEAPQATAPSTPEAAPTDLPTLEAEQGTEQFDFGLRAEDYTQDPSMIIVDYYKRINSYLNTGISEGDYYADERFTMDANEYAAQLNRESDEAFFDQLFDPDWRQNPELVTSNEWWTSLHGLATRGILLSSKPGGDDATYEIAYHVSGDSIAHEIDPATGAIELTYSFRGYDNRHPDAITINPDFNPNELSGTATITFTAFPDGSMRVVGVSYAD